MKSLLQTKEWLDFQESIGHKTWQFNDGKIRANIIQHKVAFGKNYLYIPHGPEIFFDNVQGGLKNEIDNFLSYLKKLAKENKSIFVKFEPLTDVVTELVFRKGVKRSKKQIQPYRTVIVDLGLSEEQLLERMHHKTRYNVNLAARKGLEFGESGDVETFWKLLGKTSKKDRFFTHKKDYYEKLLSFFKNNSGLRTELFLVHCRGQAVAGAIVMFYGDTAYYLHGAMDRDYKELMAPYFLHWRIIRHAKETGCNSYDLWGVDARNWPGVTRFKLGWLGSPTRATPEASARRESDEGGGGLIEYPGSFDMPISKFWYLAYNLARKIL